MEEKSTPREYIESTMAFVNVLRDLDYIDRQLREADIFDTTLIEKVHLSEHHYTSKVPD